MSTVMHDECYLYRGRTAIERDSPLLIASRSEVVRLPRLHCAGSVRSNLVVDLAIPSGPDATFRVSRRSLRTSARTGNLSA